MGLKDYQAAIQKFDSLKFKDYTRKGQDYEFIETNIHLKNIAEVLDEVKEITPKELIGKDDLYHNVIQAIQEFNSLCEQIKRFDPTKNDPNREFNNIKSKARKLYNQIFIGDSSSNYSNFPALAYKRKLEVADVDTINNLVDQIMTARDKASSLIKQIQNSSRSKFAHDYSKIFHFEAIKHSRLTFRKGENSETEKYGVGIAEFFLLVGLALVGILIFLVGNDFFIPDSAALKNDLQMIKDIGFTSVSYTQVLIPVYLKKLIILGLLLFGLRFCFRQFSIHKHLHTVNKHRANTLDSFEFFHDNLKDGDAESRDQYLIEVAKSIFNLNDTGFIRNDSKESISFVDNFKFFKDKA